MTRIANQTLKGSLGSWGFTLIELMVTLAILAVLGALVVPVVQIHMQRQKEGDLRLALKEIRGAIDAYKKATDEGRVRREPGASGYPTSLKVLIEGVDDQRSPKREKIYFLRRMPRDPFHSDHLVKAHATWGLRSYASDPSDPKEGDDVYDIYSKSASIGLNGIPIKEW